MHQMRVYAKKTNLKASYCYYKKWGVKKKGGQGHKPVISLRFSKIGDEAIERWYATHFVDTKQLSKLKSKQDMDKNLQGGQLKSVSLLFWDK